MSGFDTLYLLDGVAAVFRLFLYIIWFAVGLRVFMLLADIEKNRREHQEEAARRKQRADVLSGLTPEDLV